MIRSNLDARFALVLAAFSLSTVVACGADEESEDTNTGGSALTCAAETDGHSTCNEGTISICHADDPEDIHFDNGANCASQELTCTQLSASEAGCVDPGVTCTAADVMCDSSTNTAFNCSEGRLVVERCGSAAVCEMHEGEAHCEGGDDHDHDHEGSGEEDHDHDHEGEEDHDHEGEEDHDHEGSGEHDHDGSGEHDHEHEEDGSGME
jgi:hypothetical protein